MREVLAAAPRVGLLALVVCLGILVPSPPAGAALFWAESGNGGGNSLGTALDNGGSVNRSFVTGADYPWAVAVNSTHLFWTNAAFGNASIGRSGIDGGTPVQDFISNPMISNPRGVAVDDEYVYWIDADYDTIGRANLNGTGVDPDWLTLPAVGFISYTALAVDESHVYWTSQAGPGAGRIGRAGIDGGGLNASLVTGLTKPSGLALNGAHLYWVDSEENTVGRAGLDGTDPDPDFFALETGVSPKGIALDDQFIYYAAWGSGSLGRVGIDGAGDDPEFVTGLDFPSGVALTRARGSLTPESAEFGSVEVGDGPSSPRTFTLASSGEVPLTVAAGGISVEGNGSDQFEVTGGTCSAGVTSLPAGQSCTVAVSFQPGSPGLKVASLELVTNDRILSSALFGRGTSRPSFTGLRFTPATKRVKAPKRGSGRVAVTVRVTNSGSVAGTATVALRSSSRKVRVPRSLRVQVAAGSSGTATFRASVLAGASGKAVVTAELPNGKSTRLVLKIQR